MSDLIGDLASLAGSYLSRQRWYARPDGGATAPFEALTASQLLEGDPGLVLMVGGVGGDIYQLLIGLRADGAALGFLGGHEDAVLGHVDIDGVDWVAYDAVFDGELCVALLEEFTDHRVRSARPRLLGAEQSNTSIVYDERLIAKVFRRLRPGVNPDVAVSFALDQVGFNHIAAPIAVWRRDGFDLAYVQQFLAGGTDGWALALTSLRDLYDASTVAEDISPMPADQGGDFSAEANRLGHVTARLHLALAEAFGASDGEPDRWAAAMSEAFDGLAGEGLDRTQADVRADDLRAVKRAGRQIRVHGDYHLGQVMRTDAGWFVLDFEGEPARSIEERAEPRSPLKDVSGMLRSFQYASAVALQERAEAERTPTLEDRAAAWEDHNRAAFLDGYRTTKGIEELVPADDETFDVVLTAFELEKALYELRYERAYRPEWASIPAGALARLLDARRAG